MKIGILSDSHQKPLLTQDAITLFKENHCEYLLHAGDFCIEENLESLKESGLPYVSVFGNNDMMLQSVAHNYKIEKEPYYFKIKEYTFKLMHLPYYLTGDTDIVIFGHTHAFEQQFKNDTLFINPGEVCARNKPISECAMLEIKQNQYIITYFTKNLTTINPKWEHKEFIYERQ